MIYQIKITLDQIRPPIWRRVQVADETSFAALHQVIQMAMGWQDNHIHEFEVAGQHIGPEIIDDLCGGSTFDEMNVALCDVITREEMELKYTYDFGDGWEHTLTVEKILSADTEVSYPICLKGERACPPEDCASPQGYADLLVARKHPNDPRSQELLEWAEDFDPELFDLDAINDRLESLQ